MFKKAGIKIFTWLSLLGVTPFVSSCQSNKIVFANYESYMSEFVKRNLEQNYNISFLPYETNEEIENKFTRYYDIAIPSTYELLELKSRDLISTIDWSKFNLTINNKPITNGTEARDSKLFSDSTKHLIQQQDIKYHDLGLYPDGLSLLDFGIPYFLQSFSFAYKGSEIENLENATHWSDVLSNINSYSENTDPRFSPDQERRIAIVDDQRSVFGVANTINNGSVNPLDTVVGENDFFDIYQDFSSNFKKQYTYFNTDSGQIISTLSKHYPEGSSCGIAYNGDILYAAQGGGMYSAADPKDFHFCNLSDSLIALDMVVINKNAANNPNKIDQIYDIIKDVCLSGTDDSSEDISTIVNDNYLYDSMNNFASVEYTSPLEKIHNYVMNGDFFEGTPDQIQLYKDIFDIDTNVPNITNYVEEKLKNELAKSNMHWAYAKMKWNL